MYRHDCISQMLCKYRFNLYRNDEPIEEYLERYLNIYYNDIKSALEGDNSFLGDKAVILLRNELPMLKRVCTQIPVILKNYGQGNCIKALTDSNELFSSMESYLITGLIFPNSSENFYRIREGDFTSKSNDSKTNKRELFHIPKKLRSRIGSYRFSIAGSPCLYLAGDKELAWYECGMPNKFSYCQMSYTANENDRLNLLNFSYEPLDFLSSYYYSLINYRRKNNVEMVKKYEDIFLKYVISYPLVISCSMKVKDKSVNFVEEYIMPQLLMQWIRSSEIIDGVIYKSSLYTNLVEGLGAKNIALPVKKYREDGLDEFLTEKLSISDIGYIDVSKVFEKYTIYLTELDDFVDDLKLKSIYADFPLIDYQMIEFSYCIIKTYNSLMSNNYKNLELVFIYLNEIYEHFELFYKFRDANIQDQIDSNAHYFDEGTDIMHLKENELEKIESFKMIVSKILKKNVIYDFGFENLKNYEKL